MDSDRIEVKNKIKKGKIEQEEEKKYKN